MKTCSICDAQREITDFHKGYTYCKICYNSKQKAAYKEKHHLRYKEYYQAKVLDRRENKRIAEGVYLKKELRRVAAIENKKVYNEKNKEKHKAQRREWVKNNRPKINTKLKERLRNDTCFKIAANLRTRIYQVIKLQKTSKSAALKSILGCSITELKSYLESKFLPGMSWQNHTRDGWHIDHIKPCASFDLSKEEDQRKCFHYTNLQPLWATDNMKKGDRILTAA